MTGRIVLASAVALSAATLALPVHAHESAPVPAVTAIAAPDPLADRFGGPFSLVDHTGRRVSDTDLRGRFLLVYFGFTHCVDVCTVDLAMHQLALREIGPLADRVQPLFITVDPQRDTPDVLARYLADFHPATLGLTGSEGEIAAVAKAYRVHRRKVALDGPEAAHLRDAAGAYIVDHGPLTYLMGPDGRFRTLVPHTTTADRLAGILRSYVGEGP